MGDWAIGSFLIAQLPSCLIANRLKEWIEKIRDQTASPLTAVLGGDVEVCADRLKILHAENVIRGLASQEDFQWPLTLPELQCKGGYRGNADPPGYQDGRLDRLRHGECVAERPQDLHRLPRFHLRQVLCPFP